jgi:hypothetical protein
MSETVSKCAVQGCDELAAVEVILYDIYELSIRTAEVFFEQDYTCPYLCTHHLFENERGAIRDWSPLEPPSGPVSLQEIRETLVLPILSGQREARGGVSYPYTNRDTAQGFSIYRPIS